MKWRILFIFIGLTSLFHTSAQKKDTLSLNVRDVPLEIILDSITLKSGYYFSYNADAIPEGSLYALDKRNIHINELLELVLVGTDLTFTIYNDQIILKEDISKKSSKVASRAETVTITGWVREYESKAPIYGVNVYVNGTTMGAVTDQYGNYRLTNIPFGSYLLIFSHIGYEVGSHSIKVGNNHTYVVNALLDFKLNTLDFIEILSDPLVSEDDWPKHFRTFKDDFIGTSGNASRCDIVNPEALEFAYDEQLGLLKGEATEPLIIENRALGYRIEYDLEYFEKDLNHTNYYGKARFQNILPDSKRIRKKWKKNRLKSYQGSLFHFFQSLTRGNLAAEGFRIYTLTEVSDIYNNKLKPISRDQLLTAGKSRYEWKLDFDGYLLVSYEQELESTQYLSDLNAERSSSEGMISGSNANNLRPGPQKSILELKRTFVTIDHNGQVLEQRGLTTTGYWAWERVGELMPADYDPNKDNL